MEKVQPKDWIPLIKPYTKPSVARSLRQVADTLLPLLALFYLAHKALSVSLLLALALDFVAALFLVRLFILQHDAGHGARQSGQTIPAQRGAVRHFRSKHCQQG